MFNKSLEDIFNIVNFSQDIAHTKIEKYREVWEFLGLINCNTLAEELYESGYRKAEEIRNNTEEVK